MPSEKEEKSGKERKTASFPLFSALFRAFDGFRRPHSSLLALSGRMAESDRSALSVTSVTSLKTLEFPWCFSRVFYRKHEKTRENTRKHEKKRLFRVFYVILFGFPIGFGRRSRIPATEEPGSGGPRIPAPTSPGSGVPSHCHLTGNTREYTGIHGNTGVARSVG